jgi:11beta/17beta-hydroxysteroid dehydrogenase
VVDFYETLRYEVKEEVGVTVATHGWVSGDAGGSKFTLDQQQHHQEGAAADQVQWKQQGEREPAAAALPGGHVEAYARALVAGACRGDAYVKRPSWYDVFLVFRVFAPDVLAWTFRLLLSTSTPPPAPARARARSPRVASLPPRCRPRRSARCSSTRRRRCPGAPPTPTPSRWCRSWNETAHATCGRDRAFIISTLLL